MKKVVSALPSRFFALSGLCLLLALLPGWADADAITVTITKRSPMAILSSSGEVSGVMEATVGAHYTFVSAEGNQVTVQDAQGARYRIAQTSTDCQPAAPTTTPVATTNNPAPVPPPTPAANVAPPSAPAMNSPPPGQPSAPASGAPVSDDTVAKINTSLGKPLFTTQVLWKESTLLVANRLGLKLEDRTKWEASYRRYFYDREGNYAPAPMLGGGAYCVVLYADANDAPTSVLVAFTNDGDYEGVVELYSKIFRLEHPVGAPAPDADKRIAELQVRVDQKTKSFEKDRQTEQATLTKNLTDLFGDPKKTSFGSDADTREDALRWDWNGVSFLLSALENKYNLLRIIPLELADNHGRTERIPRDEMAQNLAGAVEHRPNGDVVITQIPMADQGKKGYCVPATWERVLRYTGVPGDMYTLSRIGGAGFGGGEQGASVATQLDQTLHNYGRRAEFLTIDILDTFSVRRYIDKGIPIFWGVNPGGYAVPEQRYALCDRDKDWDTWKKLLEQSRVPSKAKPAPLEDDGGHQVLITGYNPETKEIAWSDPWGRYTQERWMTQEEAQRCSLGQYYIISW